MIFSSQGTLLEEVDINLDELFNLQKREWSPDGRKILICCEPSRFCLLDIETLQILNISNFQSEENEGISKFFWLP
jgi:hypothetical protein